MADSTSDSAQAPAAAGGRYGPTLALLASLFFMWGFITVINNTLLPHLRSVFDLNYTQTTVIESVWFIAYFVASIPSAMLIRRIGYKPSLVVGLCIMAAGALGMVPAAQLPSYGVTLVALFVIASGITLLQVAANPYVAVVGPPESSESRLTLVQAFNSMGTFFAPYFGGYLILSRTTGGTSLEGTQLTAAEKLADAQATQLPYVLVAGVLLVIALIIWRSSLPALGSATQRAASEARKGMSLWAHRNLVFAVPAIFIYLIAEIGVANLFINFVIQPDIAGITPAQAANYLVLLWGGMMVGRFAGSFLMRRFDARRVLACFALFALAVMVGAATLHGPVAMWCLILVGLGHSIMFPTIFALGIKDLGEESKIASSFIVMSIVGGAIFPLFMGLISDATGSMQNAYIVPMICFMVVLYFGWKGHKIVPVKK